MSSIDIALFVWCLVLLVYFNFFFFFFNDTATTEIYTLSLHDALPICPRAGATCALPGRHDHRPRDEAGEPLEVDRKSTRLNSSHSQISYAVFCLKKKKNTAGLGGARRGRGQPTRADSNGSSWIPRMKS